MKQVLFLLFAALLLTGCNSVTYPKIEHDQPFIATVNIKDTSLTFLDEQYKHLADWDLSVPFMGGLLLEDGDTLLLYGKDMDSIEVFSLEKGKQIDSWEAKKGIVNMKLLQDGKSIVAVNQSLNNVSFYNEEGRIEDQIKVGKSPMTLLQDHQQLYVINFGETKLSVINLYTRKVERDFVIQASSTGALLREEQQEIWIGGHGAGANMEENVRVYSTETGELKRTLNTPIMPINIMENAAGIFILSHGSNALYKVDETYKVVKSTTVGVNPFEMMTVHDDILIAGYDNDELYVMDSKSMKVKQTIKVGKGPFQMISRE
ncbi:YncE family protein [Peribacillus sp. Hz7]|uniref:YncE family protein n=1 Tax=Peribacillus sp. Hz7 TaxID=3344873 RepID=UPI0035CB28B2